MTGVLFFGGILNRMFLNIPYYDWIMVAMILLGMAIGFLFWFLMWWPNEPYQGYLWTAIGFKYSPLKGVIPWAQYKGIAGMSFVFNENMHFDFITDRDSKVIFNQTFKERLDDMADSLQSTLDNAASLSDNAHGLLENSRPAVEDAVLDLRETVRHLKTFARTMAEQ